MTSLKYHSQAHSE